MSRDASIDLVFAGDERSFRLTIEQLLVLEDLCDCGTPAIAARLATQTWRVREVREPIRLGLIGKGVDPRIAKRMVDENVIDGRLVEHALIAQAIVMAALVGDPREQVGKEEAATDQPETGASPLPPSMESQAQSASL